MLSTLQQMRYKVEVVKTQRVDDKALEFDGEYLTKFSDFMEQQQKMKVSA